MNNKKIIGGIVLLVLVGGGLFIANRSGKQTESAKMEQEKVAMMEKDDSAMEGTDNAMMKKDEGTMEKDDKMMEDKISDSRYVEYSKSVLDDAASDRRVLFFYASWCPTCKSTDADLTTHKGKIPEDVTVIRVNYNDPETDQEEKDLAKKYGITYQHTFVQIDSKGNEVVKWNGGSTPELLSRIK